MLEWLTEIRGNIYIYWFTIKVTVKDTDEEPDEEVHRVRAGRVLSAGPSVLIEFRCT